MLAPPDLLDQKATGASVEFQAQPAPQVLAAREDKPGRLVLAALPASLARLALKDKLVLPV